MTEEETSHKAKAAKWRELLMEQAASGKSIRVFCAERGLSRPAFQYWRNKDSLTRREVRAKSFPSRFIAVSNGRALPTLRPNSPQITLPNGVTIDLGISLESPFARQILMSLCGVDLPGVAHAKS